MCMQGSWRDKNTGCLKDTSSKLFSKLAADAELRAGRLWWRPKYQQRGDDVMYGGGVE